MMFIEGLKVNNSGHFHKKTWSNVNFQSFSIHGVLQMFIFSCEFLNICLCIGPYSFFYEPRICETELEVDNRCESQTKIVSFMWPC